MLRSFATLCLLLVAVLAGCTDAPTVIEHRANWETCPPDALECEGNFIDPCDVATVEWDDSHPRPGTLTVGTHQIIAGVGRFAHGGVVNPNECDIVWNVSSNGIVSVVEEPGTYLFAKQAKVTAIAPGQVTVTLTVKSRTTNAVATAQRGYTVPVPPTATPTIGTISGPATVPIGGAYEFSVTAFGGNGSTYTFEWQKSSNGGATWTSVGIHSGGPTATAMVVIAGGELAHLRVRAKSGTSAWSAFSPAFVVDARNAPPALEILISGPTFITWDEPITWTIQASGGNGVYTYEWQASHPNSPGQWNVVGTGQSLTLYGLCYDRPSLKLRGIVRSNGGAFETSSEIDVWLESIQNCPS